MGREEEEEEEELERAFFPQRLLLRDAWEMRRVRWFCVNVSVVLSSDSLVLTLDGVV